MRVYIAINGRVEAEEMEDKSDSVKLKKILGIDDCEVVFTKGHNGGVIDDDDLASIEDCCLTDLKFGLLGGKVHGSLARAGKVRAQTPKIDKEEKKKKATGRAHRRAQYAKKFCNVAVGLGRKRGPNSNAA